MFLPKFVVVLLHFTAVARSLVDFNTKHCLRLPEVCLLFVVHRLLDVANLLLVYLAVSERCV